MYSRSATAALALLGCLTVCAHPVAAAVPSGPSAFDADSATLRHPYATLSVGDTAAYSGYGNYRGDLRLESAVRAETVDGVECLLVAREVYWSRWNDREEALEEFQSTRWTWLAEDVVGNVWILALEEQGDALQFFGATTPVLYLAAELQVGDEWQGLFGQDVEVLSVTRSLDQLRNGLGPFTGCAHLRVTTGGGVGDDLFYAPTRGMVYSSFDDGGRVEGWERVPTDALRPGPGSIQFSAGSFRAVEGPDWFQATVVRGGGNEGVVSVHREISESVAATNPGIFFPDQRIVYLAPGQASVTFDVRLNNDGFWSHQRTMTLALSDPGGGASLGPLSTATVIVQDDESGEDGGNFIGPCFLHTLKLW